MEMCYDGALVMPNSYAVMSEDEMMYVEGGKWSGQQVLKNVCGIIAVFSLGYAGAAFKSFVAANKGLSYGKMLLKAGATLWKFIKAAPWQVKLVIGASTTATLYALGSWDLF